MAARLVHIDSGMLIKPGSPVVCEDDPDGTGTLLTYKGIAQEPEWPSGLNGKIRVSPACSHPRNNHPRCCVRHWREINPSHVGARIEYR